ncbi:unnamed protein product [Closterium sp. Yama58-4]|nr:unnamed protein product [Closterium sp. Yama58-4]
MVLCAFLPNPADHSLFLAVVRSWPPAILPLPSLIARAQARHAALAAHARPSAPLLEALAELSMKSNNIPETLRFYLLTALAEANPCTARRVDAAYDLIRTHASLLMPCLKTQLPLLLAVDPSRCIAFVSARVRLFPPSRVVHCIACLDPLRCPPPSTASLSTATLSPFPPRHSAPSPPPAAAAAATALQSGLNSPTNANSAAVYVPTVCDATTTSAVHQQGILASSHRETPGNRPQKPQLRLQLQSHEGGEEMAEEGWEGATGKEGGQGKEGEESEEGEEGREAEEDEGGEEGEGEELEGAVVRGMGEVRVRHLMFRYLHTVFVANAVVGRRWHTLQVHLYAEFQPSFLLSFLRRSSFYSLDAAYRACQQRGLQHAMVLLQQRMGNHHAALSLCLHALGDVDKALQVIATSGDDSLCASITHQAASNPRILHALLDRCLPSISPVHLVRMLRPHHPVPRLKQRLIPLLRSASCQVDIERQSHQLVLSGWFKLFSSFHKEACRAVRVGSSAWQFSLSVPPAAFATPAFLLASPTLSFVPPPWLPPTPSAASAAAAAAAAAAGLIFSERGGRTVVFFCRHSYHRSCLLHSVAAAAAAAAAAAGAAAGASEGISGPTAGSPWAFSSPAASRTSNSHLPTHFLPLLPPAQRPSSSLLLAHSFSQPSQELSPRTTPAATERASATTLVPPATATAASSSPVDMTASAATSAAAAAASQSDLSCPDTELFPATHDVACAVSDVSWSDSPVVERVRAVLEGQSGRAEEGGVVSIQDAETAQGQAAPPQAPPDLQTRHGNAGAMEGLGNDKQAQPVVGESRGVVLEGVARAGGDCWGQRVDGLVLRCVMCGGAAGATGAVGRNGW